MKACWLLAVVLSVSPLGAQTLRVVAIEPEPTTALAHGIELLCTEDYDPARCRFHAALLARELSAYSLDRLAPWRFALAPSSGWSDLVRSLGGDPRSPAFSVLDRRVTVLEEALFAPTPRRHAELLASFRASGSRLLPYAVAHELGHALCAEADERLADLYGRELRAGRSACGTPVASGRSPSVVARGLPPATAAGEEPSGRWPLP